MKSNTELYMEDARRFYRVTVHLPVAVRQHDSQVFLTESLDISEGGVLIKNNLGDRVNSGDVVKVHIEGILGEDESKMILHPMRIVRIDDEKIALEFV